MIKFKRNYSITIFQETSYCSGEFTFKKGFSYECKVLIEKNHLTYYIWYDTIMIKLMDKEIYEYLEV